MSKLLKHLKSTPQTQQARSDQVKNNAGGFVFEISDFQRLDRFLILGTEGGSYYEQEGPLTLQNIEVVERCMQKDALETIKRIVDVAKNNRSVKREAALLSLAMVAKKGPIDARPEANKALAEVAKTGTDLFYYATCVDHFGGWGDGTKRAIRNWYYNLNPHKLALQLVKYRNRHSWTHRDLLRKIRPDFKTMPDSHKPLLQFAVKGTLAEEGLEDGPRRLLEGYLKAQEPGITPKAAAKLITDYGIPREALPTEVLGSKEVWAALLDDQGRGMAITALARNLGKMTSIGLLSGMNAEVKRVVSILEDKDRVKASGFHPVSALLAQKIYAQGKGLKGSLSWQASKHIVDALESTFIAGFDAVVPTGKNFLIGLDVSGSMSMGNVMGIQGLSPREITTAITLVLAKTERWTEIMAFSNRFMKLDWTNKSRVRDAMAQTERLPLERTDCALPMQYALQNKIEVDTFIVMTDNETYAGSQHPYQALADYRRTMNRQAKLIVLAATPTRFSIADPRDPSMLDIPGFSGNVPTIIREFTLM